MCILLDTTITNGEAKKEETVCRLCAFIKDPMLRSTTGTTQKGKTWRYSGVKKKLAVWAVYLVK